MKQIKGISFLVELKAFLKAWKEACEWKGRARVWIPEGTFQLSQVSFEGPCKGYMTFVNRGVLVAPTGPTTDKWIGFKHVNNLSVFGGRLIGQGATAWHRNDCQNNPNCQQLASVRHFSFIIYVCMLLYIGQEKRIYVKILESTVLILTIFLFYQPLF